MRIWALPFLFAIFVTHNLLIEIGQLCYNLVRTFILYLKEAP